MSAILPGSGQAYNHKYWKMPIVYAGMGTCAGFIIYNNQKFHHFLDAYVAETDGDLSTINETNYSASSLLEIQDSYRSWRDLSYICLAGVYILQIIDANVDAHLWYFDVGDDLSLMMYPSVIKTDQMNNVFSISLQF